MPNLEIRDRVIEVLKTKDPTMVLLPTATGEVEKQYEVRMLTWVRMRDCDVIVVESSEGYDQIVSREHGMRLNDCAAVTLRWEGK